MKKSFKLNFLCSVYYTQKVKYIHKKNFRKFSKQEGFKYLYADGIKYNKLLNIVPIVETDTKLHIIFPPNSHGSRTIMKDQQC